MATKVDTTAQKKKRQTIILVAGGAILLLLAVIQAPKLFGGSSSSTSSEPAETTQATPDPAATGTAPVGAPVGAPATGAVGEAGTTGVGLPAPTKASIYVGGVPVTPAVRPPVLTGQLWSFSRFKEKDPFVPQVRDDDQPVASAAVAPPSPPPAPAVQSQAPATATAASGPAKWATVTVNGRQSSVQANGAFPQGEKRFVLVSLKRGSASVAPAGGKLAKGKAVTLTLGNPVTLVDAVTGKRYTLELVYTGPKPEQVTTFSG